MTKPHFPTRTDARKTSPYGYRVHPITGKRTFHDGLDLAPKRPGTTGVPIYALRDGVVRLTRYHRILGYYVTIQHTEECRTSQYQHLAKYTVKEGQRVKAGDQIGIMGTTGSSTGIHLHLTIGKTFPIKRGANGNTIDPEQYFKQSLVNLTVDGSWGGQTTRALQSVLGTPVDGVISNQVKNRVTENIHSVTYGKGGSLLIKKMQQVLKVRIDGYIGEETTKALQRRMGTPVTGGISKKGSAVVKEMQRRLNENRF